MSVNNIRLKFSYLALKLLGKNLYSNAWAAISELVANGLDAKAKKINVYIDMTDKRNSKIEVFDDGCGMSFDDFEKKYSYIGRNRRDNSDDQDTVMGRKGIGKLAALYLSRHYYISSKEAGNNTQLTYEMDFPTEKESLNDDFPELKLVPNIKFLNQDFNQYKSGTMVHMEKVDLTGYADFSLSILENVLSDFFSVDDLNDQNIFVKVVKSKSDISKKFEKVKKKIPFKNMAEILCFDEKTYNRLKKYCGEKLILEYKNKDFGEYESQIKVEKSLINNDLGKQEFVSPLSSRIVKHGELKGWIGIHSSIDTRIAIKNDKNFKKSKLYNPLKLRIYVRNKLAISDFLPVINNTQVFNNFIEGEIGFDILDDNDFPDIATTNRQNMDENDRRIKVLADNIKKVVTSLIQYRQNIAKKLNNQEKEKTKTLETTAKNKMGDVVDKKMKDLYQDIDKDTLKHPKKLRKKLEDIKDDVKDTVIKNLKGDMIKTDYMIFFSHSRKNKAIMDFYFYLLKKIGVKDEEMFYTSRENMSQVKLQEDLSRTIKQNITRQNSFIFFYSTEDFKKSDFCMFEGGAAWATRSLNDYIVTADNFNNRLPYLESDNKFLFEFDKNTDIFDMSKYSKIVELLNLFIDHLNKGRKLKSIACIPKFSDVKYKDKVQTENGEKMILDKNIIEYWYQYVTDEENNNKIDVEAEANKRGFVLK